MEAAGGIKVCCIAPLVYVHYHLFARPRSAARLSLVLFGRLRLKSASECAGRNDATVTRMYWVKCSDSHDPSGPRTAERRAIIAHIRVRPPLFFHETWEVSEYRIYILQMFPRQQMTSESYFRRRFRFCRVTWLKCPSWSASIPYSKVARWPNRTRRGVVSAEGVASQGVVDGSHARARSIPPAVLSLFLGTCATHKRHHLAPERIAI